MSVSDDDNGLVPSVDVWKLCSGFGTDTLRSKTWEVDIDNNEDIFDA